MSRFTNRLLVWLAIITGIEFVLSPFISLIPNDTFIGACLVFGVRLCISLLILAIPMLYTWIKFKYVKLTYNILNFSWSELKFINFIRGLNEPYILVSKTIVSGAPDHYIANQLINDGYLEYLPGNNPHSMNVQIGEPCDGLIKNFIILKIIENSNVILYKKFETRDEADIAVIEFINKNNNKKMHIDFIERPSMKLLKSICINSDFTIKTS